MTRIKKIYIKIKKTRNKYSYFSILIQGMVDVFCKITRCRVSHSALQPLVERRRGLQRKWYEEKDSIIAEPFKNQLVTAV